MLQPSKTMTTSAKTKRSKTRKTQQAMVPIHIKITEEMHELLSEVAKNHGFPRIQGLIRLYIRQGLEAEDVGYCLADDERFLQKLRRQGVSDEILEAALNDNQNDDDHEMSHDAIAQADKNITSTEDTSLKEAVTHTDSTHPDLIIR